MKLACARPADRGSDSEAGLARRKPPADHDSAAEAGDIENATIKDAKFPEFKRYEAELLQLESAK